MALFNELLERNRLYAKGEGNLGLQEIKEAREETIKGQKPDVLLIMCSDSRLTDSIFLEKPGEVFTIRVAGNVVIGEDVKATIEYGVNHLKVKEVVVMGHENCGAVGSAFSYAKTKQCDEEHLKNLLEHISQNFENTEGTLEEKYEKLVKENVKKTIEKLKSMECIKKGIERGMKLIGAYYKLSTGEVEVIE